MRYDIDAIRKDDTAYRRRFNEKFLEYYKVPFDSYVSHTKRFIERVILAPYGRKKAEEALREYQNRIKHIKSLIDNGQGNI